MFVFAYLGIWGYSWKKKWSYSKKVFEIPVAHVYNQTDH